MCRKGPGSGSTAQIAVGTAPASKVQTELRLINFILSSCSASLQNAHLRRSCWSGCAALVVRHKVEQSCRFDIHAERRDVLTRESIYNYALQTLLSGMQLSVLAVVPLAVVLLPVVWLVIYLLTMVLIPFKRCRFNECICYMWFQKYLL